MEAIPTVENGGLIATYHPNFFMVNTDKKPSQNFNLFVSDCLFGCGSDSSRKVEHGFYASSLLYYNNKKHMFIMCGNVQANKDNIYQSVKQQMSDNEYGVFIVTAFNTTFSCTVAHDKNAKCVCGDYRMLLSYSGYSHCSIDCQKREQNKQNDLLKSNKV